MEDGIYEVLEPNDPAVAQVGSFVHGEWTAEQGLSREQTIAWCVDVVTDPHEAVFAARLQGQIVGCACLVGNDLPSRPDLTPWLSSVYVAPSARGQGLASRLIAAVEQSARLRGHSDLYLFTPRETGPVAMYARRGWKEFASGEHRRKAIVIMDKRLSPSE